MTSLFRKAEQRILALWFPHLSSDRVLRCRHGRSWRSRVAGSPRQISGGTPLLFSRRENNTQRIAALDERAEALGLKHGMGIADARAMHPSVEVVEADPEADHRLLGRLADWCDRYTPLVALDGEDGLFLDITGCAHLLGGEGALAGDVLSHLLDQGFDTRAGLASTPGAAWASARFGMGTIAPGREAEAMASLPLSALRLDAATRESLESVGLRTIGLVAAAPRSPLARRFGRILLDRLDQALGRIDEPLSPRLPVASLAVERQLAEPVTERADIERLLSLLARTLKEDLERRGEGARRLELALFRVDGAVRRLAVGAARPLRDPAAVALLFREKLTALEGALDAGCGFDLIRLSVHTSAALAPVQADLAGRSGENAEALAFFAGRLAARLGEDALLRPCPMASHIPERAVVHRAFMEQPPQNEVAGTMLEGERPIRLLGVPEPVEVTAAVPDGPPARFRWRRVLYAVARAEGPERIAPEWWLSAKEKPTRDYFRVEDEAGRRYWLYRQGLYGEQQASPRWFMHGFFA